MYHLTDELVAAIVTKYGDALPRLNLSGNSLHTINGISRFSSVESLDLSRNQITDLGPIAAMTQLRELNLAENSISSLQPLSLLTNLASLDLMGNCIASVDQVASCLRDLHDLRELKVSGNPLCTSDGFDAASVFAKLPQLRWLDGAEDSSRTIDVDQMHSDLAVHDEKALRRKVAGLEAQLSAMEGAFAVQERLLSQMAQASERGTGQASEDYFAALQQWRKQTLLALADKFACESRLRETISGSKKQHAQFCTQKQSLEAQLLCSNERSSALSAQVQHLRTQLAKEGEASAVLSTSKAATEDRYLAQRQAINTVRYIAEEAKRRLEMSQDFSNLTTAAAQLVSHEGRLAAVVDRLELAKSALALREVQLRNSAAALEAEKLMWRERRAVTADDEGDSGPHLSDIVLRPEAEALLRAVFLRLDVHGTGEVDTALLLQCVSPSETNSLYAMLRPAVGGSVLDTLTRRLSGLEAQQSVTWGEFLLLFFPEQGDVPRAALTKDDLNGLTKEGLWGDSDWAALPLMLSDDKLDARRVEISQSAELARLSIERAFLMRRCQEMGRTLERRAEGIKAHFATELRVRASREAALCSQVELYKERVVGMERALSDSEARLAESLGGMSNKLEVAYQENAHLAEKVELLRGREGLAVDKRLADEAARSAKLDTEYKLLKRENGKLEVRCKALHRDLLRLQVSCSGNADGVAALASDKAALLEELATLRQDSAVTALRLVDATESLLREKGAAESESRRAEELRRENAVLAVQMQELRTQMREPIASSTVGTDTEDLRPVAKRSEPPRRAEESDLVGDMRGDALEANIARLTRLADALLHRD